MMTTTLELRTTNPYILALQSQIEKAADEVRWLVIAQNDPQAVQALSRALASEAMAVLNWPAENAIAQESGFLEAIRWAVRANGIQNIVLLGHSHGTGGTLQNHFEEHRGILAGTCRAIELNRESQQAFSKAVAELIQNSDFKDCLSSCNVNLSLLYYRAIDKTFLTFNAACDEFLPLIEEPSRLSL